MAEGTNETDIEVEEIRAWYGSVQALFGLSFSVKRGSSLALVGTNGAGKTSTIRAVLGLIRTEGNVRIAGTIANRMPCYRRCREFKISVIHEGRGLFYDLTVLENIKLNHRKISESVLSDVIDLFPSLQGRLHDRVGLLSGGEQQMVAIARVLAARPAIVLLDEPGLGLSPRLVGEVYSYLDAIKKLGATIILVEQSIERAVAFVDSVVVISGGRVLKEISTEDPNAQSVIEQLIFGGERAASGSKGVSEAF
jgi:branched-chain amino acid transport system ATP-binding protein